MSIISIIINGSIVKAARYLNASQEVDGAAVILNGLIDIAPDFEVSDELGYSAIGLFEAISQGLSEWIALAEIGALSDPDYYNGGSLLDELEPWRKAKGSDHLARFGWVHRIVNEMLALRDRNGFRNLGEPEFNKIFEVIAANKYDELLECPR